MRRARPMSAPTSTSTNPSPEDYAMLGMPPVRARPIFEEHRVAVANNCLHYMSIKSTPPGPATPHSPASLQMFKTIVRSPRSELRASGRLDGKGYGGRIGRCRGLGGNPVAWRPEGFPNLDLSEYKRSYVPRPPSPRSAAGVGMRTEVWSGSEGAVYGTRFCRSS